MILMNRRYSQLPYIETLEDRFLPSATTSLPVVSTVVQSCMTDVESHAADTDKEVKSGTSSALLSNPETSTEQIRIADTVFGSSHADLSQAMVFKPMIALISYQPATVQYHETIFFTYLPLVPLKPMANLVKAKGATPGTFSPDVDDVSSVVRNVITQSAGISPAVRSKVNGVEVPAKDLVETMTPTASNRTEAASTANVPGASLPFGLASVGLPALSLTQLAKSGEQGTGLRSDTQTNETQESLPDLPPDLLRRVAASPGNDELNAVVGRLTEKEDLHTDESSLVLKEIEHALQSLVEPFTAGIQSYEPTVLWVFLTTWAAAAGITYEYLRRKVQQSQLSIDTWKEWRSLPQYRNS